MSMDRTRALERIRKCLALSGSPEPHEAAAALRQATKLMELHGISHDEAAGPEIATHCARATSSRPKLWEINLAKIVARQMRCSLMTCRMYAGTKPMMQFEFVGVAPSSELAAYAFEQLRRQCAAGRAAFVADKLAGIDRTRRTRMADGWCEGWSYGIHDKLETYAKPDEIPDAVRAHVDAKDLTMAKERKSRISRDTMAAVHAGLQAGKSASLHRGMGADDCGMLAIEA